MRRCLRRPTGRTRLTRRVACTVDRSSSLDAASLPPVGSANGFLCFADRCADGEVAPAPDPPALPGTGQFHALRSYAPEFWMAVSGAKSLISVIPGPTLGA